MTYLFYTIGISNKQAYYSWQMCSWLQKAPSIVVYCLVSANSKTGVEMEALSGVTSALLAIYDLSKIVEPNLKIQNTKLLIKSGGKKGLWINPDGVKEKIKSVLSL